MNQTDPSGFPAALYARFLKMPSTEGVGGLVVTVLLTWLRTACRWALSLLRDSCAVIAGSVLIWAAP